MRRERGRRVEGAGEEVSDRAVQRRLLRRRQLRSLARCRRGGLELRLALARERHAQHRERARRQALSEAEARLLGARQPEALEQRAARPGGRARAQLAEVEPHNAAVCRVRSWHEAEVAQVPAMLGVRLQEGRGHGMGGGWRGGGDMWFGLSPYDSSSIACAAPPRPAWVPRPAPVRSTQASGRGARGADPPGDVAVAEYLGDPTPEVHFVEPQEALLSRGEGGGVSRKRIAETATIRGNCNDSRKLQRFAETATATGAPRPRGCARSALWQRAAGAGHAWWSRRAASLSSGP